MKRPNSRTNDPEPDGAELYTDVMVSVALTTEDHRSMPAEILMPALSPTMEEGKLAKWLVREGDEVRAGDVIAEIETDKATMEVEAVDDGTLGKILVAEGTEHVPVNTPIALLLTDGEDMEPASSRRSLRPALRMRDSPAARQRRCRARARSGQHRRSDQAAPQSQMAPWRTQISARRLQVDGSA